MSWYYITGPASCGPFYGSQATADTAYATQVAVAAAMSPLAVVQTVLWIAQNGQWARVMPMANA
jgi:hypothetical protein